MLARPNQRGFDMFNIIINIVNIIIFIIINIIINKYEKKNIITIEKNLNLIRRVKLKIIRILKKKKPREKKRYQKYND
jgi:hypothetical protein